MNYFLDTEFSERAGERPTIDLISIAIVTEAESPQASEYYWESSEFNEGLCSDWVKANVLPKLNPPSTRLPREQIRDAIIELTKDDPEPVFWAYYADYDWVAFCWLFGTMMNLPENFPMLCMDLQQWWIQMGKPDIKPPDPMAVHSALADALWNRRFYRALREEHDERWGE